MAWQGTIVFFDLETTGLDAKSCHIVQLGASCENHTIFNRYILPGIPIEYGATEVNGLTVSYGQLLLHGEPFADGVYLILLMGLLEDYFVPLFNFFLTPESFERKVHNVAFAFELMQDGGLKKPKARPEVLLQRDE
ncbi:uncharacterized protein LOC117497281 isoform X8 [Trematomus bernacchii]|uniref:uncharacterized protein LOC117497281 isoform X8 n=1 Tax=Trematomus bernacchii TaxID=40690 RepID=UPI00146EB805|nr:uncharacterized protein LOC117497281 isoform X8 [Trematomus bernacchii]